MDALGGGLGAGLAQKEEEDNPSSHAATDKPRLYNLSSPSTSVKPVSAYRPCLVLALVLVFGVFSQSIASSEVLPRLSAIGYLPLSSSQHLNSNRSHRWV
jgi:hypothetical protein